MSFPKRTLALIAAVVAALAGGALFGLAIAPDNPPAPSVLPKTMPPGPTVTVPVDGADADTKRDDPLVLDERAAEQLQEPGGELGDPLREPADTAPPGVVEGPLAAQEFPGCRTSFGKNYSSRNGTRPQVIMWHQTVSRERGWSSQNALTGMTTRPSTGVSWHLLIGRSQGLCTFTVPLHMKAWTQGNANPFSIGIEVEAYGDEASYVTGDGRKKLIAVTRELGRRFEIPMRRAKIVNCRVIRSGIAEHNDAGACGGGHVDVSSTKWQRNPSAGELAGWDIAPLIADAAAGGITATDRVTCRKLNAYRISGRPKGGAWERNSVRRRQALLRRDVLCTKRGPVKT